MAEFLTTMEDAVKAGSDSNAATTLTKDSNGVYSCNGAKCDAADMMNNFSAKDADGITNLEKITELKNINVDTFVNLYKLSKPADISSGALNIIQDTKLAAVSSIDNASIFGKDISNQFVSKVATNEQTLDAAAIFHFISKC